MKHLVFSLCGLAMILGLSSTQAHAQAIKIGYVNSAKVLLEYPEAIETQKKLDVIGQQWQDELEKMDRELKQKYEDFQKKEPLLKDDEKRAQRDELVALQQKGAQYQQERFGSRGALARATDSLLQPIKQKVMKVIEQVAKEQKVQFMFDRNDQILVLLYGEPKYDYTFQVIDRLKRGTGK
ncbi:MAG: OmpH family outer membrane protein [Ignavibacteriae bacterium]|nr:OmpH family outer membrane protein [Ignavibacteria bacterium]MBI3365419.1 OmpH family outer membrane protein [Ignavibacteriota bacterium]